MSTGHATREGIEGLHFQADLSGEIHMILRTLKEELQMSGVHPHGTPYL